MQEAIKKEDKKDYLKKFGAYFRYIRKKHKVTSSAIADSLDMQKSSLTRLEQGGTNPTLFNLKRLADELNITLTELIDGFEKFEE